MLVEADGDADVVISQPDSVSARLRGTAAVTRALNTLVKGMPVSPTMPTIASGLATVELPPVAN
jgi:hypothetical protein